MRYLLPTLLLIAACGGGGAGPQLGFSAVSGRLTVLSVAPQRELQTAVPWPSNIATAHVSGWAALYLVSNPQLNDATAFTNARQDLLALAESTATFSNTTGFPHSEDFVDASGL